MHGLALGVVQVDGSALVVVSLDLTQMHAQVIAQLTELGLAGVLQAELERCLYKRNIYIFFKDSKHVSSSDAR